MEQTVRKLPTATSLTWDNAECESGNLSILTFKYSATAKDLGAELKKAGCKPEGESRTDWTCTSGKTTFVVKNLNSSEHVGNARVTAA